MLHGNQSRLLRERGSLKVEYYFFISPEDSLSLLKSRESGLSSQEVIDRPCRRCGNQNLRMIFDLYSMFANIFLPVLETKISCLLVLIPFILIRIGKMRTDYYVKKLHVIRDGRWTTIKECNIVYGDVISLCKGDKVLFESRILKIKKLLIVNDGKEKIIDSMEIDGTIPRPKDQNNMLHRDDIIIHGSCEAVVVGID